MSAFDQMIDQHIFGRQVQKLSSCLGLFLSPDMIYLAETRLKDGRPTVEHLVRVPIPSDIKDKTSGGATLSMSTDALTDPTKMAGLIRQSMAQTRWGTKNVVVSLSHHLGLLRYFPMPPIERRFLKTAVPVEAKKYIPIPFDALVHDYHASPMSADAAGKPRLGVLIAVTQKKNVSNLQGLLESLGLKLAGIEVAPCSVLRLWQAVEPPADEKPFVQIHFDGGSVRTLICDRGLPVFFRETFLGASPTLADQRKVDLSGCLSFAQKQLSLPAVSKVTLSGTPAALGPWKDAFAKESGLPVAIQDTAKLLSIKGGDWGGYAAIGASARALYPEAPGALDLAAQDRIGDDERQTARDILLAGAALAGVIALAGVFQRFSYEHQARALKSYTIDADVQATLQTMTAVDVESRLKDMREQSQQLAALQRERPKLSAVLKDIIDLMPENVWLFRISAQNPLMGDRVSIGIALTGRARGATVAEEQALAFAFRDALLRSETIGKRFEVSIALTGRTDTGAAPDAAAGNSAAFDKKLEERTEFTLQLREKS